MNKSFETTNIKAKSVGAIQFNREVDETQSSSKRMKSNFDYELKRLQAITNIERELKKSGKDPMSLLQIEARRTYLDRISIPKRLRCRNKCCKCNLTFYFCLMVISIIDVALLLKFVAMLAEMYVYNKNYPVLAMIDILIKFVIQLAIVFVETIYLFQKQSFSLSKITYGLKFVQILFVLFQAFCYRETLSKQCNIWLSTKEHGFHRDSSDINRARPMA